MEKAIMAFIVTIIAGYLGGVFGYEVMGGFPEFGCILAVAVMGAFIIYFNDKKR